MAAQSTVRIAQHTHRQLKLLAKSAGEPLTAILDKAIEAYRRTLLLEQSNEGYARLRRDKKKWKQELSERMVWDRSVSDGLDAN